MNILNLAAVPAPALVLVSVAAVQFGSALATLVFPILGVSGTVAMRIVFSALLLLAFSARRIRRYPQVLKEHGLPLLSLGICICAMNLFFYQSISRIPLGAAVAFEFVGPLGLAALTSNRFRQYAWIALAAVGVALLSPFTGTALDMTGIVCALLAGVAWALFIVLAGRLGRSVDGNDALVIGMSIAAVFVLPLVVPITPQLFASPSVFLAAFGVAVLSTALPFTLEFAALKRLSARHYGILIATEPVVATMVGAAMLGERLGPQGLLAILCVVVAAVGITLSDKELRDQDQVKDQD